MDADGESHEPRELHVKAVDDERVLDPLERSSPHVTQAERRPPMTSTPSYMPTLHRTALIAVALVAAGAGAGCPTFPEGPPCASTADCCQTGPADLCSDGECVYNQFCAGDPNCFGSRFGVCTATVCGDGVCSPGELCASDCTAPTCGDGRCSPGESCPSDCPQGSCAAVPMATWPGAARCLPLPPVARFVVDELTSLWGIGPTTICAYQPFAGAGNACGALPPNNAVYCGGDNSISWDVQFMDAQFAQFGDFAPVVVVAHEWGHRNDAANGLLGNPSIPQVYKELHADCQAGIFAAFEESRGLLSMGDAEEAFRSLCSLGGASGWFDPSGHGSCEERVASFMRGLNGGRANLSSVCASTQAALQAALAICQ